MTTLSANVRYLENAIYPQAQKARSLHPLMRIEQKKHLRFQKNICYVVQSSGPKPTNTANLLHPFHHSIKKNLIALTLRQSNDSY